jgi:cellulose synthase/poly-beta-1,6-N-acetylglucosamine synthase-like glycosyltransferase
VSALEIAFWACVALIVHTHLLYPALMVLLARLRPRPLKLVAGFEPSVSLIVTCHDEEGVIQARIRNALQLEYPEEKLEVLIASDGSGDRTVALALDAAAADERVHVLDLPRRGKIRAQDAAVLEAKGEIVAFSDANAQWAPGALRALVAPFADPSVGYVCGEVSFSGAGSSQEGIYWRYEMALRRAESDASSITGGNGAIYATRARSYLVVDERMGHDLSFPFNLVKRGWRAVFAPGARASERMVPHIAGEFRRKRRMMSHAWPIVLRGGLISPRGYGPVYAFQIFSHRVLRYATPFLHAGALALNVAILAAGGGPLYVATLAAQALSLAAIPLSGLLRWRGVRLLAHYWLTTLSVALGLWDYLRRGTPATWEPTPEAR